MEHWALEGRIVGGIRGLVISLDTGRRANYTADGQFRFEGLSTGQAYAVTISEVPAGIVCTMVHGTGTAGPDMLPVEVSCTSTTPAPPSPVGLQATYSAKAMTLSWIPVAGASEYIVWEDPDGSGSMSGAQVKRVAAPAYRHEFKALLHTRLRATYQVQACNGPVCGEASPPFTPEVARSIGYFKPSATGANDQFGYSVALSADGSTMAVGAYQEDGAARGVNGDPNNRSASDSGAVYVFVRQREGWIQQAYIKASNTASGDNFGWSVALSSDGNVLAVSALREDGAATGVDGDQSNRSAPEAGAVYVFRRAQGEWAQESYLKASNTDAGDNFGTSVSLSGDGATLAVGAFREDSGKPENDAGSQSDNSATDAGSAYVFVHAVGSWHQQAYIKASNPGPGDFFGVVALSGDGQTLAVGAQSENSAAAGVNGDQNNDAAQDSGAAYVYERTGESWHQVAYLKPSNTGPGDNFGIGVAISHSGDVVAIGAPREDSASSGIDGDGASNASTESGAAYVFERRSGQWAQSAYVKPPLAAAGRLFGFAVALSGDGRVLAVCAPRDSSGQGGIDPDPDDSTAPKSGAVHVLRRGPPGWQAEAYLKAPHPGPGDQLGGDVFAIAISPDGAMLAAGARLEDSSATRIGGDDLDNDALDAGAVYVY